MSVVFTHTGPVMGSGWEGGAGSALLTSTALVTASAARGAPGARGPAGATLANSTTKPRTHH